MVPLMGNLGSISTRMRGRGAKRARLRVGVAFLLPWMFASAAMAQLVPAADPARLAPVLPNPSEKFEELRGNTGPARPEAGAVQVPQGAESVRFTLKSLNVQGMSAYQPADIGHLYADDLGKEITLARLYAIANDLQQIYFDDGYTLTKIIVPDQSFEGGQATLVAVEGHVSQIEVDPALIPSPALADAVDQIRAMKPLNTLVLERLLLVLNALPDMHASAILASLKDPAPGEQEPGAIRLLLKKNTDKKDKRFRLAVDNYGSQFTGPSQGVASAHLFHVGAANSDLALALSASAPYEEQHYANLGYTMPIFGASGAKLNLNGVMAETNPGSNLSAFEIEGKTRNISATVSYPIVYQRAATWTVDAGFLVKNSQTDLLGTDLYDDRLREVRLGTNYSFSDTWDGFNAFDFHATQGLDLFGASDEGSALSRADGKPEFTKFEFFAGRVQDLPAGFEIYGLVSGQYSLNPLLSSEEFGFGGGQVGRGYDPSEITGDHGISGTFELRHTSVWQVAEQELKTQPFIFYDIGKVWNEDNGARNSISAASTGAGVRFNLNGDWDGSALASIPLTKEADNPPDYATATGTRFLLAISRSF